MNNFLFVAAENDAIPECKAGGMGGDVVRDVPVKLPNGGEIRFMWWYLPITDYIRTAPL